MKYKLLLNGNFSNVRDFFFQHDITFDCQSTSDIISDIKSHIKTFKPDAFVRFVGAETEEENRILKTLQREEVLKDIPVILIGDAQVANSFYLTYPQLIKLVLARPITVTEIDSKITEFLANKKSNVTPALTGITHITYRKKHTILVVDDDKTVLILLKDYLEDSYDVVTVASGKMAMRYLEKNTCDLVLLDYEMPGEDGIDVFKKIRMNAKSKNVPIVFLTGVADPDRIKAVLSLKPSGYLLKPININMLQTQIEKIFS